MSESLDKMNFLYEPFRGAYPNDKERKSTGAKVQPLDANKVLEVLYDAISSNQPRKFQEGVVVLLDMFVNGESSVEDPPTEVVEEEPVKAAAPKKAAAAKAESAEA